MLRFLLKLIVVALMFFNATTGFSQHEISIEEFLVQLDDTIKIEKYDTAEMLLDSILRLETLENSDRLHVNYKKALLYKVQNKNDEALELLLLGLTEVRNDLSSPFVAEYAYQIGSGFSKIEDYPNAYKYYKLVLESARYRTDSLSYSKAFIGLGSLHFRMYREKKFDSIHEDSLKYYYDRAIAYHPKLERNKDILAITYTNLIGYNYYTKEFDKAEYYGKLALKIRREANDSLAMRDAINTLGAINIGKKEYAEAIRFYNLGLNLVKDRSDYGSVSSRGRFLNNLSDAYARMENFEKAYAYRLLAIDIIDSLAKATSREKYAEFEAKYNLAEEEKLTAIERGKRQKAESWLVIVAVSMVIIFVILIMLNRIQRIKKAKELLELQKVKVVKEREIEKIQSESQIKILNAAIDGKETERRQIAEILHNSVSALLSSAGLHLQAAKIGLKDQLPDEIVKSQEIVKEAGDKIRNLSHALISSVLLKFGLKYAIGDLCEKYSNSKLTFSSDALEISRYDSSFEIKMHSIIEELMNNIIKHSNASKAEIILKEEEGKLRIRIFDNGEGFDVEKLKNENETGLGLPQIDARIKMMKGEFNIQSSKKAGTRIYMNVPLP